MTMYIGADQTQITNAGITEACAKFIADGAVELFHDGTKQCETSADGLAFPNGKGINFNATADASGTGVTAGNETFSDYEEGTWTPSATAGTFTTGTGTYTKVGRLVTAYFVIEVHSTTSGIICNLMVYLSQMLGMLVRIWAVLHIMKLGMS